MREKSIFSYWKSLISLALLLFGFLTLLSFPSVAAPLAHLESPAPAAFLRSGVGLIRGWACEASRVEVSVDGGPLLATAHGTDRPDTVTACGHANTGFGLTYNWNRLGEGLHNLRAFADGVLFADVNFTVATLGGEFLTGLQGEYTVADFPAQGNSFQIRWSEPDQNFMFVNPTAVPPVTNPPTAVRVALESPAQGSSVSGIGLIRGWVCAANKVEVSIDGGPLLATAHGTDRPDTATACGHADTGFGLTYNWNRLGNGVHNLRAYADDIAFADVNFTVATLGGEFLTGLLKKIRLLQFPNTSSTAAVQTTAETGPITTLEWSEADQNFVIAASTVAGDKIALGSLLTDLLNKFALLGVGIQADSTSHAVGVRATKDGQGLPTAVEGLTWSDSDTRTWADLNLGSDNLPAQYRDSSGAEARLDTITDSTVNVSFVSGGGQVEAGPITVPINGRLLHDLQTLIDQVRARAATAQSVATQSATTQPAATAPETLRQSLNALLANLLWASGAASGETLCAIQDAASAAGRSSTAPTACRSSLLVNWVARATGQANPQAVTPAATESDVDPQAQQSLQFVEDVTDAPCSAASSNADCLIPAATELVNSILEAPVIPPDHSGPAAISVPDVVGLTQSAAASAIVAAGLTVGSVTQQASTTVPSGTVISQNPAAGASVATGSTVDLVVSSGPAPVTVPNVVGTAQTDATNAIAQAGLIVGSVTQQASTTVPSGTVISQNPAAGASVATGSAVDLVVSSGPAPVTVPNVVGLTQSAATSAITQAGLIVGSVTQQASTTAPSGTVISQNPAADAAAAPGSAVDLVVSSGPVPVTVPNVVGLTQSAAASAIVAAGLTVGSVTQQASTTVPSGTVIRQNPVAGTSVQPGSAVDLVVSGPAPITVPNVVGLTQSAATSAIIEAGLTVGQITQQASETVPAGTVIRQNPAAGTSVQSGSAVDLVVSGLAPVTVPNVVGMTQTDAVNTVTGAQLVIGTITNQNSATFPAEHISNQTPAAGAVVTAGSLVDLIAVRDCSYGPDTCLLPYVWREASSTDHVCVTVETRSQTAYDNSQASARINPDGGPYGPDTCLDGYVWREAFSDDHVCVTVETRSQATYDNSQASSRKACLLQ